MPLAARLKPASRFAFKHLLINLVVAALCAALVFGLWYPHPFNQLSGGQALFLLVVAVDVVCGPVLSLVVYDPAKPRRELLRDIGAVVAIQLLALAYGLWSVVQARPVHLAFEIDRFRVVTAVDVEPAELPQAPAGLRQLGYGGPGLVGVRRLDPADPGYPQSILAAMSGLHPAFRPSRWVAYDSLRGGIAAEAKPLDELRRKQPAKAALLDEAVRKAGLDAATLGYYPLVSQRHSDWVTLVDRRDGSPRLHLPIDGW